MILQRKVGRVKQVNIAGGNQQVIFTVLFERQTPAEPEKTSELLIREMIVGFSRLDIAKVLSSYLPTSCGVQGMPTSILLPAFTIPY